MPTTHAFRMARAEARAALEFVSRVHRASDDEILALAASLDLKPGPYKATLRDRVVAKARRLFAKACKASSAARRAS